MWKYADGGIRSDNEQFSGPNLRPKSLAQIPCPNPKSGKKITSLTAWHELAPLWRYSIETSRCLWRLRIPDRFDYDFQRSHQKPKRLWNQGLELMLEVTPVFGLISNVATISPVMYTLPYGSTTMSFSVSNLAAPEENAQSKLPEESILTKKMSSPLAACRKWLLPVAGSTSRESRNFPPR